MKKLCSVLTALVMAVTLATPALAEGLPILIAPRPTTVTAPAEKSDDIVILYTNDVHTYIDGELSYDTVAALKADLETQYEHVLLVDVGDHIQGTAYGSMDKGKTVIDLMNAAGYDVAALGNHEFDYGMDGCMNVLEWAEYPYISCNFYHEKNGVPGKQVLNSYELFACGDETVAFVGVTTPETFTSSTPAYFQDETGSFIYGIAGGADGQALYDSVQVAVDEARAAGATIVIALGHLGTEPSVRPWTSEEVIANVSGLSAWIDGHSHYTMEANTVTDEAGLPVLLTQTGEYFGKMGKMVIDADTGEIATKLLTAEDLAELTPDADVKTLKDGWVTEITAQLGRTIGILDVTLDNYAAPDNRLVRIQETNSGDFSADAIYYLFDDMGLDVDVAITNGGGVRNFALTGDVSYLTCKNIHPFGNVACLQTITGQQLLDALEWGARMIGLQAECGGFLQVSGLTYSIDASIPSTVQYDKNEIWTGGPTGEYRVHNVKIYNKDTNTWDALDLNAAYNLAGFNYSLRELGDGYAMFEGSENVLDYVMEDYMVLANYVQGFENQTVKADNSPLLEKYPNLLVDYSTIDGSGRITMQKKAQETPVVPPVAETVYTVRWGDTLWALSRKHGCTVSDIVAANSKLIKNPDLIYVGWELVIPQK